MKQKSIKIKGIDYTLQHPGIRWYLEVTDRHMTPTGIPNQAGLVADYLEHVVVQPAGLTLDDLDKVKGKTSKITIGDKKLNLKHPGLDVQLNERCYTIMPNGVESSTLKTEWMLKHVVEEEITIDDFYSMNDINKLVEECTTFLQEDESFVAAHELISAVDTFLRG